VTEKTIKGTVENQVLTERARFLSTFNDYEPPSQSDAAAAEASETLEDHMGTIPADMQTNQGPRGGQTQKHRTEQCEFAQVAPFLVDDQITPDQNVSMQNFQPLYRQSTSPAAHGPSKIKRFSKGNANKVSNNASQLLWPSMHASQVAWHKFTHGYACRDHS
jgi:hypothetical protein